MKKVMFFRNLFYMDGTEIAILNFIKTPILEKVNN